MFVNIRSVLSHPWAYHVFLNLMGSRKARRELVARYIRPKPSNRILDMGCGPGILLPHLPSVDYTGIDISPEYVQSARRRYGRRATFRCADVARVSLEEMQPFDIVVAVGLLHHLDDRSAARVFSLAGSILRPKGRLITYDNCFVGGQSWVARRLIELDRGQWVRTASGYRRLAAEVFGEVSISIHHDLINVPYTHIIMECVR